MGGTLVTGANGFVGSAVCRASLAAGDLVYGLVRPGSLAAPIPDVDYRTVEWDHAGALAEILREIAPERVIHCAGANVRSVADVASLYEANVRPTWQLLAAMSASATSAPVVVLSSAAVYGPDPAVPTVENHPLAPATHYAWSKALSEQAALAFASAGADVRIARLFNIVGENEPRGSVVRDVVDQIRAGSDRIRVRETSSVRDYVDVLDAAAALLAIAAHGRSGEAYNVCTGVGTSVGELVSTIKDVWGSSATVEIADPEVVATVSIGSPGKLSAVGFSPSSSMRSALERLREGAGMTGASGPRGAS